MSLLSTSCHGYEGTLTGWNSGISRAWALSWFKTSDGSSHRGLVQITEATLDGTQQYLGLAIDGSNVLVAECSTENVDVATPDPGNFYLWNSLQQNKWTLGCSVFDQPATAADLLLRFGRAAATAKPATTLTVSSERAVFPNALTRIYVGRDRRVVVGGGTTDATNSTTKISYIAIGQGNVPSEADIQDCIDGQHPADLPGIWEYWDLTSSGSGLVGALQGITLAPFGGSATTTWDGADNPTVSAPSGGGGGSSNGAAAYYYSQLQGA